jgi:hypothetical protein
MSRTGQVVFQLLTHLLSNLFHPIMILLLSCCCSLDISSILVSNQAVASKMAANAERSDPLPPLPPPPLPLPGPLPPPLLARALPISSATRGGISVSK